MEAELRVLEAAERGLDVVMVRPPWFYGPHQPARQTTFFTLVRTGRFPVFGDGGQRRSMVYIDNLVDGIVRAELTPTDAGLGLVDRRRPCPTPSPRSSTPWARALRDEGFDDVKTGPVAAARIRRRRRRAARRDPAAARAGTSSNCTCSAR